jgi:hypothetical protein
MPYKDPLDKKRQNKRYYYTHQETILRNKRNKYLLLKLSTVNKKGAKKNLKNLLLGA